MAGTCEAVGSALLAKGDAKSLPVSDGSVDLVVTSPPYFGVRSYRDSGGHVGGQIGGEATAQEYIDALLAVTAECVRVLKPSGSIFVNLGDKMVADNRGSNASARRPGKHAPAGPAGFVGREMARQKSLLGLPWRFAIGCIDQLGLILRAEIIWSKVNGLPEGSVRDRVQRQHEQWFHFTVEPRYFSNIDEVRVPHAAWTAKAYEYEKAGYNRKSNEDRVDGGGFAKAPTLNPLGKVPGSVWQINSDPLKVPAHLNVEHFAPFPQEFPRRMILGWSPPDGVVLDPFSGSGTTVMVARALGRHGIGLDLSDDYLRLAAWRVFESRHADKSLSATDRDRQMPMDFEGVA